MNNMKLKKFVKYLTIIKSQLTFEHLFGIIYILFKAI